MVGRPTKLTPELLKLANDYLSNCADQVEVVGENRPTVIRTVNLPTIEGFAKYLGIHRDTVYEWKKDNQEFSDIVEEIMQEQAQRLLNNGLSGAYNPTIAKLILSGKHGYVEKSEIDQNHSGNVSFVNDVPRPKD